MVDFTSTTWMMDAMAESDGTIRGIAKFMGDHLSKMPQKDLPENLKNTSRREMDKVLTGMLKQAYRTSEHIQNYMDQETQKGRAFDEVYEEVKVLMEKDLKRTNFLGKRSSAQKAFAEEVGAKEGEQYLDSVLAARKTAPHRRLRKKSGEPRRVSMSRRRRSAEADEFHSAARASELHEPLALCGNINNWDAQIAKERFLLRVRERTPILQDCRLRLTVPPQGVIFQLISARQETGTWRIVPVTKRKELVIGEEQALPAGILRRADPSRKLTFGKDVFFIKGTGEKFVADVWASISLDRLCVWLEEAQ